MGFFLCCVANPALLRKSNKYIEGFMYDTAPVAQRKKMLNQRADVAVHCITA